MASFDDNLLNGDFFDTMDYIGCDLDLGLDDLEATNDIPATNGATEQVPTTTETATSVNISHLETMQTAKRNRDNISTDPVDRDSVFMRYGSNLCLLL